MAGHRASAAMQRERHLRVDAAGANAALNAEVAVLLRTRMVTVACLTSHVTRHTSHVTHHTSHVTRHTPLCKSITSPHFTPLQIASEARSLRRSTHNHNPPAVAYEPIVGGFEGILFRAEADHQHGVVKR